MLFLRGGGEEERTDAFNEILSLNHGFQTGWLCLKPSWRHIVTRKAMLSARI